jgi:hypothetical protein
MKPEERRIFKNSVAAWAETQNAAQRTKGIKPPKFPMKFKEFLRRAFGGRLHSERLRLYRKYLVCSFSNYVDPEDVAAKTIEKFSRNGISNPTYFFEVVREIAEWRANNRLQQRRNAAKSRWQKKSKKSLDRDSQSET